MLSKLHPLHSFIRSIQVGSLLVVTSLGLSTAAHAGDETTTQSGKDMKDKNVIQQPPPKEPKFYIDLLGGAEFDYHATKFINDGTANFGTAAAPFNAKIQSRDFSSTHDPVVNARANIGYQVLPYLAVFGGFTYSHANGHERRVGSVTDEAGVFANPGGRYDLYASVGDYQAYAGRGGFKLSLPRTVLDFIHAPKFISPYFSASAGGKYIESQEVSFYSGTRQRFVDTAYGDLYDNSWVLTAEGDFGYELKFSRNFSVIIEDGEGYETKPSHSSLGSNVSRINADGDRFFSTVSVGGRLKF